ncbi:ubiquitin-domain-containing protein [Flagelloscypha sp. PMI_526]|nr:ubiquitin-domain-containing protein [Flagelloscypha sp. PMI_526]
MSQNSSTKEIVDANSPAPSATLSEETFGLVFKTLTGKTGVLDGIRPDDTVLSLKQRITNIEGIPPEQQRLIITGRCLTDEQTMEEANINAGDVLHLVLRMRKPVIYLRSPQDLDVSVRLELAPQWKFSAVYPVSPIIDSHDKQSVKWDVRTRSEDRCLIEQETGVEAAYLYWEADSVLSTLISPPSTPQSTSLSSSPNTSSLDYICPAQSVLLPLSAVPAYLDRALKSLAFDVEARTSFITFWLPEFNRHAYIALSFLPQAVLDKAAPLIIQPSPDAVSRVFMVFRGGAESAFDGSTWDVARSNAEKDVRWWRSVIGSNFDNTADPSLFRVLEWGGMCIGE